MIAFKRIENEYTDMRLAEAGWDVVMYHDISFDMSGRPRHATVDIANDNLWYFRAVGRAYRTVDRLVAWGREHGKIIMDNYLLTDGPGARSKHMHYTKLLDAVNQPQTTIYPSLNTALASLSSYPVILKFNRNGRKGMGTFLLREEDIEHQIRGTLENRKENGEGFTGVDTEWLVQEYIPNNGDYRAMVIDGRCIGMYKRRPKKNKLVCSSSNGKSKRFKSGRFPSDVARMAEQAAMTLGISVCGVDLVRHSDTRQVYVIEANEAPAFQVFERVTRISVADAIAEAMRNKEEEHV